MKVVCKRRGEEGRGSLAEFWEKGSSGVHSPPPDLGTMAHKAGNKERGEGRKGRRATKQGRSLLRRRIEPHDDDDRQDGREESKT